MQRDEDEHLGLARKFANETQNLDLPVRITRRSRFVLQEHLRFANERVGEQFLFRPQADGASGRSLPPFIISLPAQFLLSSQAMLQEGSRFSG